MTTATSTPTTPIYPADLPHAATVHECEFTVHWHDILEQGDERFASGVQTFESRLPHCLNRDCECTRRAAEAAMAGRGSQLREWPGVHLKSTVVSPHKTDPANAPCYLAAQALYEDYFAAIEARA